MSEFAAPPQPLSILKIVTQVFLLVLGVLLAISLFNLGNILYYAQKLLEQDHARTFKYFRGACYIYVTFSALALLWAGVRLQARSWHLTGVAQVAAIINAFGIILIWGLNALSFGIKQLHDPLPSSPLIAGAALLLANILTACMLSGVLRLQKMQAGA